MNRTVSIFPFASVSNATQHRTVRFILQNLDILFMASIFFFMLMFFLQYCIKILFILKLEHFCAFFLLSLLCDHHSFVHLILSSILRARSSFFQMRKVWPRDYRDLWCDGFCPRESNPEVRIQDDRSFCLHQGPHI